jgi:ribonuclease R
MAKAPHDMKDADHLPSKEAILDFIRSEPGETGKREIARAFGLKGGARIALKRLLRDMEDEGLLGRKGKALNKPGTLPPVVLAEITLRDRDGDLLAVPLEWDEKSFGKAPRIHVFLPKRPKPGLKIPGFGDRVLLRVEQDRHGDYSARIIKLLDKTDQQMLGVFRASKDGGGRIMPIDKKAQGRELSIRPGDENGAKEGDLVSVVPASRSRFGLEMARVKERLGSVKSEKAISLIAIFAHNIPNEFSKDALSEAASAKPATLDGREDWRALPLITIDPADAKDHDDAVHAARDDHPENKDGFIVTVAIADVAAYVRPGSALDREAVTRGNSVYFPDRVVPMLPERISNDLCSLRPFEDRPALAVRLTLNANGQKLSHSFHRVMMRSAAKLAYPQAQAAIEGRVDDVTGPLLEPVLQPLWDAYHAARRARDIRQPLDLDLPERKILLKPDGTVDRVIVPERLDAHRLIEEFMILANVAAAETLEKHRSALLYRVHDEPSTEKMRVLGEVLASIGIKIGSQGALTPELFNRILAKVEGSEHQLFVNEIVLRSQAQAQYAADNLGHFGLNLRRYAHFTSPIRRYADLIVHRALIRALKLGPDGLPDSVLPDLPEIAAKISAAERRAMAAERETIDRLIAHHMADKIGAQFDGKIAGVTKSGLFVKLHETGADGFVPASTLGADFFRYDEPSHALIGERTGETFRLGDPVTVKLVEAAPIAGALRFEILSAGRKGEPRGKRGRTPHRNRTERTHPVRQSSRSKRR